MQDYFTFLLIPGNPGNDLFYENFGQQFVQEISKKQTGSATIYTISHLNHAPKDKGCSTTQQELFNLSEQIEHKLDFCREHLSENRSLYLVGHSIGAYICLRMLDQLKKEGWTVSGCYCLFPAVERMAKTPSGQKVIPLIQVVYKL
uniref:Lipid droplet-associated hydrolase n=1 Tax=Ditylenchus dipsaci TaxID=166011 RepID=A0A915E9T8_9BILA